MSDNLAEQPENVKIASTNKPATRKRTADAVPPLTEKACVICGNHFMPLRRNQVVCSDACRYQRSLQVMEKANHKRRGTVLEPKECVICGATFMPRRMSELCCSDSCKGEYLLIRARDFNLRRYYNVDRAKPESIPMRISRFERMCALLYGEIQNLKREIGVNGQEVAEPETVSDTLANDAEN